MKTKAQYMHSFVLSMGDEQRLRALIVDQKKKIIEIVKRGIDETEKEVTINGKA